MLGTDRVPGLVGTALLAAALAVCLPLSRCVRAALDALVLGEASERASGLDLRRLQAACWVATMALATGAAVAQTGLVAFVGLAAPHLVRRSVVVTHGPLLALSALAGAVLIAAADVIARSVAAPRELPVGWSPR